MSQNLTNTSGHPPPGPPPAFVQNVQLALSMLSIVVVVLLAMQCVASSLPDRSYLRPAFHFLPRQNWMNDPNGPFYDQRTQLYHLFFQYNPTAAVWGDMTWGHAVSFDLLGWHELDPAIAPDSSYDGAGAYSGSVTLVNGVPTIVYTCVDAVTQFEQQCIAFPPDPSESLLTEWIKSDFNPVYSAQFARDPTTAWNNGTHWQLAIGQNGHASLLTSSDFLLWQNTGILYENANFSSIFWECPDLYIIPGSSPPVYVFKASANFQPFHGQDVWSVGHFDPSNRVAFAPLSQSAPFGSRLYDYGGLFYASKSFHDSSVNRQVLFGWINEADAESEHIARGWAGMQSVPREIHLRSDGFNIRTPVIPALEQLRGAMESLNMTISQPSDFARQLRLCSNQFDLITRVHIPAGDFDIGIRVLVSPDRLNFTQVGIMRSSFASRTQSSMQGNILTTPSINTLPQCQSGCASNASCVAWTWQSSIYLNSTCVWFSSVIMVIDTASGVSGFAPGHNLFIAYVRREHSSITIGAAVTPASAPIAFAVSADQTDIDLRILVDHSIVELFVADSAVAITSRVYPPADACSIWISSGSLTTEAINISVRAWPLATPLPPDLSRFDHSFRWKAWYTVVLVSIVASLVLAALWDNRHMISASLHQSPINVAEYQQI